MITKRGIHLHTIVKLLLYIAIISDLSSYAETKTVFHNNAVDSTNSDTSYIQKGQTEQKKATSQLAIGTDTTTTDTSNKTPEEIVSKTDETEPNGNLVTESGSDTPETNTSSTDSSNRTATTDVDSPEPQNNKELSNDNPVVDTLTQSKLSDSISNDTLITGMTVDKQQASDSTANDSTEDTNAVEIAEDRESKQL